MGPKTFLSFCILSFFTSYLNRNYILILPNRYSIIIYYN